MLHRESHAHASQTLPPSTDTPRTPVDPHDGHRCTSRPAGRSGRHRSQSLRMAIPSGCQTIRPSPIAPTITLAVMDVMETSEGSIACILLRSLKPSPPARAPAPRDRRRTPQKPPVIGGAPVRWTVVDGLSGGDYRDRRRESLLYVNVPKRVRTGSFATGTSSVEHGNG